MDSTDSRQSIIRVSIDLSKFYSDHRKTAEVMVKKEFQTIGDLKRHISQLFGIKHIFLTSKTDRFLPDLEDVRMLYPNEEICVIPLNENCLESNTDHSSKNGFGSPIKKSKSSKKRSLPLSTIEEESTSDSKKAKIRKKHLKTNDTPEVTGTEAPTNSGEKVQEPQLKLKASQPVSKSAKVSTSAQTDIKCHKPGKSNVVSTVASVRLSRHNDTPTITHYIPPKTTTEEYLSKKKINIVKIDIIARKPIPEKVPDADLNITEDRVKKVVEYFEKVISPESHKQIDKESELPAKDTENTEFGQTEASNYTKIYLSQKDANSAFASQPESDAEIVEKESSVTDLSSTSANKKDIAVSLKCEEKKSVVTSPCKNKEQPKIQTENKNQTTMVDLVYQGQSIERSSERNPSSVVESESNSLEVNKTPIIHSSKSFAGVGHLLWQLKDSDSQNEENNISGSTITKRKRIRKRRKVNHNKSNHDAGSEIKSTPNSYQFQSRIAPVLNTSNSHLRFEDNGNTESVRQEPVLISDSSSIISEVFTGGTIIESTPLMKAAIITADNNEKVILENKSFFSAEKIQKSPLITGKLDPKIGDFVAFKILILSEKCTPQPSDYIIGEVIEFLAPSKTVRFKITRGIEALSNDEVFVDESNTNKGEESNIKELSWERIIEARLLYP